jgi:para-nitrobenzyl esterase
LFAHAIGESGGLFGRPMHSLAEAQAYGVKFAQSAFAGARMPGLRAAKAENLLRAAQKACKAGDCGVLSLDIDGYFLPEPVPEIYAAGKQARVPLLAGWNKDEGTWQVVDAPEQPTMESFRAMATQRFGARADEFLRVYAAGNDEEALRTAEDFAGDTFIAYSTWAWMEAHLKTGSSAVYRYRFDLASPGDPNHLVSGGAFHSDEIEYVFGNLDSRAGAAWRPQDYALSELMQTYWTQFARDGDPNGDGVPKWPAYDASANWQVMHLAADPGAESDPHRGRYLFLQQGLGNQEKR